MNVVDLVNAVAFAAFFLFLLVGTGSTLARVSYYRAHGFRRPRLLIRDANLIGGFSISFGSILLVRALRAAGADVSGLATNPWWALGTALPAIWAVGVYAYYELWVIERGADEERDSTYLDPPRPGQ